MPPLTVSRVTHTATNWVLIGTRLPCNLLKVTCRVCSFSWALLLCTTLPLHPFFTNRSKHPPTWSLLQMLDRDLEEAEEQYQLAVRAHMVVVDQLLDLQYSHTSSLEAQYNADLAALQEEFDTWVEPAVVAHGGPPEQCRAVARVGDKRHST
jgi:hypothetical protein